MRYGAMDKTFPVAVVAAAAHIQSIPGAPTMNQHQVYYSLEQCGCPVVLLQLVVRLGSIVRYPAP